MVKQERVEQARQPIHSILSPQGRIAANRCGHAQRVKSGRGQEMSPKLTKTMILLGLAIPVFADSFCDGWEKGFAAGYCYQKYSCLAPIAPLCPIQSLRDQDGYAGGYNRGFVAGQTKRADRESATQSYSVPSYNAPSYGSHRDYSNEMNRAITDAGAGIAAGLRAYQERKEHEELAKQQAQLMEQQRRIDSIRFLTDSLNLELKRRQLEAQIRAAQDSSR